MRESSIVVFLARGWLLLLPLLPSCSLGQFSVTPAKPVVQAGEGIYAQRAAGQGTVIYSGPVRRGSIPRGEAGFKRP